jgi:hypothetical protein
VSCASALDLEDDQGSHVPLVMFSPCAVNHTPHHSPDVPRSWPRRLASSHCQCRSTLMVGGQGVGHTQTLPYGSLVLRQGSQASVSPLSAMSSLTKEELLQLSVAELRFLCRNHVQIPRAVTRKTDIVEVHVRGDDTWASAGRTWTMVTC